MYKAYKGYKNNNININYIKGDLKKMKHELLILIKYIVSIYFLSIITFIVIQKIHKALYTPVIKKRKISKSSSKNKRLTNEERKRIEKKYKLIS